MDGRWPKDTALVDRKAADESPNEAQKYRDEAVSLVSHGAQAGSGHERLGSAQPFKKTCVNSGPHYSGPAKYRLYSRRMEPKVKKTELSLKDQLGTLVKPLNLVKSAAALIPFAGIGSEMLNQIDGERTEKRICALESTGDELKETLQKLEADVIKTPRPINDWSAAAYEFRRRHATLAVMHSPPEFPDRQYILPATYGCAVGEDYVLTCSEALDFVQDIANYKRGRVVICSGPGVYYFEPEPIDSASGLVRLKITGRNDELCEMASRLLEKDVPTPPRDKVKWTITPYLGQEVGFIIPCGTQDNMRGDEIIHVEFGTSVIAHFRLPRRDALKTFVTSVYSGRIQQSGSAVFSREGTLMGIISNVEVYEYDVGRRAVVKSLLGFPAYTDPLRKKPKPV
jgi:hypothetical protein